MAAERVTEKRCVKERQGKGVGEGGEEVEEEEEDGKKEF